MMDLRYGVVTIVAVALGTGIALHLLALAGPTPERAGGALIVGPMLGSIPGLFIALAWPPSWPGGMG